MGKVEQSGSPQLCRVTKTPTRPGKYTQEKQALKYVNVAKIQAYG